jgi:hypothetical protein
MELSEQQNRFIKSYICNNFNASKACKAIGISRQTYYNWIDNIDSFSSLMNEAKEEKIDFAESALMKKVKEGNVRAIIYFLSTKGKHRGYTTKTEVESPRNTPIVQLYLPDNGTCPATTKKLKLQEIERLKREIETL